MQIAVRIGNLALGAFVTALVVRTLGQTGYGEWSTTFVVLVLVGYFANFGMQGIALRESARYPEQEHEWIGAVMLLRLMALTPMMLISLAAVVLLHRSHAMLLAGVILTVSMPFDGVGALGLLFQLRVDNRVPMLVLTLRSVLWGVAVLIIHIEHGGMVALAIAMAATNAVGSIVQAVAALKLDVRWPRPSRKRVRAVVRAGLPIGIAGVLVISYARIDQVIVFAIAGSGAAGLYGSVYSLLEQAHFVPISVLTTLAPVMAASWPADRERLLRATRMTAELPGDHLARRAGVRDRRRRTGHTPDLRARVRIRGPRAAGARGRLHLHLLRLSQRQPARHARPAGEHAMDQLGRAGREPVRQPDPGAGRGFHGRGVDDDGHGGDRVRRQPRNDPASARACRCRNLAGSGARSSRPRC